MSSTKAKKLFLILGIIIFLLGFLMTISHIKYGAYIVLFGIVLLVLSLIPIILGNILYSTNESQSTNYPNIIQSFVLTGIFILIMFLTNSLKSDLNELIGEEAKNFICYILATGITFGIAYFIRKNKTSNSSFNLTIENKRILPFIVIGTIVLLLGITPPIQSLIPLSESIKNLSSNIASHKGIFTFLAMVIAAPILEELIFRGIILDGLLKKYSPVISILISSLLFGLAHINPWQFVTGLLFGIFSGWIYYKTRSVLPSIIIHSSANLSGFLLRYFIDTNSSMNGSLIEMYGGITNFILSIVGSIIILSICIYFLIKEFNKERTLLRAIQ
ncbi:MAG TPA: type II CAAX endopeptidase family protein [Ignavibacteria bacterium]